MNPHVKTLCKLVRETARRHQTHTVFADFAEMAACAISNSVDLVNRPVREERYMRIVAKYEPAECERFPLMLATLVEALEQGPNDALGAAFGELELGNRWAGQFFTPYELCRLMARMQCSGEHRLQDIIEANGYVSVMEPAAGAGAMLIAFAEAMQDAGFNYQHVMHATAQDVDSRAVHMTYLQLSLLHVPAVVILGDSLALEEREHWRTPAHILGGWEMRIRARSRQVVDMANVAERSDQVTVPRPEACLAFAEQLGLF